MRWVTVHGRIELPDSALVEKYKIRTKDSNRRTYLFVIERRRAVSQAMELEDRLIDFAVRIIQWANALPDSPAAKHIAKQVLRSVGFPNDK